jgi:hypothetical protein
MAKTGKTSEMKWYKIEVPNGTYKEIYITTHFVAKEAFINDKTHAVHAFQGLQMGEVTTRTLASLNSFLRIFHSQIYKIRIQRLQPIRLLKFSLEELR